MDLTYWHKQTPDKPLYPELIWSRPENKNQAGKLLIIGGSLYGFSAVNEAYQTSLGAGIGSSRIILPNALQKTLIKLLPEAEFVSSTPSGSFARSSLAELLEASEWSDGVIVAGDLGRNSETAIVIEGLLTKYRSQLTLTKDAVDIVINGPDSLLKRPNTLLVLTISQLQQLAQAASFAKAFKFDMDLLKLVELLAEFSSQFNLSIILRHLDNIIVACEGKISTTKAISPDNWQVQTATRAAVWWLQNPSQTFQALTSSLVQSTGGQGGT